MNRGRSVGADAQDEQDGRHGCNQDCVVRVAFARRVRCRDQGEEGWREDGGLGEGGRCHGWRCGLGSGKVMQATLNLRMSMLQAGVCLPFTSFRRVLVRGQPLLHLSCAAHASPIFRTYFCLSIRVPWSHNAADDTGYGRDSMHLY